MWPSAQVCRLHCYTCIRSNTANPACIICHCKYSYSWKGYFQLATSALLQTPSLSPQKKFSCQCSKPHWLISYLSIPYWEFSMASCIRTSLIRLTFQWQCSHNHTRVTVLQIFYMGSAVIETLKQWQLNFHRSVANVHLLTLRWARSFSAQPALATTKKSCGPVRVTMQSSMMPPRGLVSTDRVATEKERHIRLVRAKPF